MHIFQIGRTVVRGLEEVNYPRTAQAASSRRWDGSLQFSTWFRNIEETDASVKAVLTGIDQHIIQRQYTDLLSMLGQGGIEIIGYQKTYDQCGVLWFSTYGMLTGVDVNRTFVESTEHKMEITLKLLMNGTWTVLDPTIWSFSSIQTLLNPMNNVSLGSLSGFGGGGGTNIFYFPQTFEWDNNPQFRFNRTKIFTEHDIITKTILSGSGSYSNPNYPFIRKETFTNFISTAPPVFYLHLTDTTIFSAPPASFFVIDNVQNKTGSVFITVEFESNMGSIGTLVSILDLAALDVGINNNNYNNDPNARHILFVGNVPYGGNFVAWDDGGTFRILRSSQTDAPFTPVWDYNGRVPFETPGNYNRLTFATTSPSLLTAYAMHVNRSF